ncbi:alkaline phosphatase family protein [Pseudogulbenkiania sp. MAI-1]|uniref:alkaline phosphatase family protein n=1 Tax=Pseudogulbenkiania sp. MAI-1 TaxID=990370 RepID=UPI00045E80FA|nr:alkaline phosphatase family protein [Pseudogulbenkiania sp. MAI-1]
MLQHCPGSHWPDYHGCSLLNLTATLAAALGAPTGHAPLRHPALAGLATRRHVILLVIDGLGQQQLQTLGPDSALRQHQQSTLTSVFPSTTAAAITTLMTGEPPARHGLTGWHVYQENPERIVAALPLSVRWPEDDTSDAATVADTLFETPALFDRFARPATVLHPVYIADSPYSRQHSGQAQRLPYRSIEDMFEQLQQIVQADSGPSFIYGYLPQLDAAMHAHGTGAEPVRQLFAQIDQAFRLFTESLRGQDVTVLVTADHGFIDAPLERQLDLEDYPELLEDLRAPLSGERRVAFCHVRPGREERFLANARRLLGHAAWCLESRQLLEAGTFGPGPQHAGLPRRIGEVALIMKDDWTLRDLAPGEKPYYLPGVHAGVSAAEMTVPLIVFDGR